MWILPVILIPIENAAPMGKAIKPIPESVSNAEMPY